MEKYIDYLVTWLQKKVTEANAQGLVVGVSGGIDSAVVACLIKKAFPNNSLALIMPCYSKDQDVKDAFKLCNDLDLAYQIINLDQTYDILINNEIHKHIEETSAFALSGANAKARLRMVSLYAVAQNYGYLVCGTDNACEWYTGYFTKYGDGGADLAPLVQLTKSQVYEIARYFNIDQSIMIKPPSAGLIGDLTDEEEMQVTYDELEKYLNGEEISQKAQERIEYLHRISRHKRSIIDFPKMKVSDKQ